MKAAQATIPYAVFDDRSAMLEGLIKRLKPGDIVLLKGSNSYGLSALVPALRR